MACNIADMSAKMLLLPDTLYKIGELIHNLYIKLEKISLCFSEFFFNNYLRLLLYNMSHTSTSKFKSRKELSE